MWPATRKNNKLEQLFLKQAGIWPAQDKKITPLHTSKKQKKSLKIQSLTHPSKLPLQLSETQKSKEKPDEDHSATSATAKQTKQSDCYPEIHEIQQYQYHLRDIIKKPPYIIAPTQNTIEGYVGHSSILFHKQIIQGSYYIQVKIKSLNKKIQELKYNSNVRVGICNANYGLNQPLGKGESFGYNCSNGQLITNSIPMEFGQQCHEEDIIGIGIQISPPKKNRDLKKINPNSKLCFYRNGKIQGHEICELTENFYVFAISLFNYSIVQIFFKEQTLTYRPKQYEPYLNWQEKIIPYKDFSVNFNQ